MNIFGIHLEWEGLKSILEFSASAVGILLLTCVVLFYFLVSFKPRCRTVGRTRVAILYKGRGESGLAKRTWMGAVPWFAPDERDNRAFLSVCEARHENSVFQQKRVLLLTAHPDDECMFFGPCILDLLENDTQVFVLCFSPGSGGLQKVRKYELLDSCETLGIPRENVFLLNFTHLPDNPSLDWKPSLIAGLVLYHIEMLSCDAVVTFDNTGISGHVNHRALYLGVKMLLCTRSVPAYCSVFVLEGVSVMRKYLLGYMDVPISYMKASHACLASPSQRNQIQRAMHCHKSQLVWYRYLYLMFSRYLYINTFKHYPLTENANGETLRRSRVKND